MSMLNQCHSEAEKAIMADKVGVGSRCRKPCNSENVYSSGQCAEVHQYSNTCS